MTIQNRIRKTEVLQAKAYYNAVAGRYAVTDVNIDNLSSRKLRALTLSHSFKRVLELGCGTGRYFPFVHGSDTFVGVDISSKMLEIARQRDKLLAGNGFLQVKLIEDDILNFKRESAFDFIFSIGTIGYHIPFNLEVAGLIKGMLCDGGFFLLQSVQGRPLQKLKKAMIRLIAYCGIRKWPVLSGHSTTPSGIRRVAGQSGLSIISMETDPDFWNGSPMLLTLFQK